MGLNSVPRQALLLLSALGLCSLRYGLRAAGAEKKGTRTGAVAVAVRGSLRTAMREARARCARSALPYQVFCLHNGLMPLDDAPWAVRSVPGPLGAGRSGALPPGSAALQPVVRALVLALVLVVVLVPALASMPVSGRMQ